MRLLDENTGAIASVRLAPAGSTMTQIHQHGERLPHDVVRLVALHVDDEADSAGIMFEPRIVQSLLTRPAVRYKAASVAHQ